MKATKTKTAHLLPMLAALMAGIWPLAANAGVAVNSRLGLNGSIAIQKPGVQIVNLQNPLGIDHRSGKLAAEPAVDEESGLHYNWHRYYDPEVGQYLSPDPIGLGGGTRSYGYVHDPLSWVDPFGLAGCGTPKPSGELDWSRVNSQGEDALSHVMRHDVDMPNRPGAHGVFSDTSLDQVENAWNIAKQQGIQPTVQPNGNWAYDVPYPEAGLQGGQVGAAAGNPILNNIKIVTVPNTNQVVTAFPF